MTLMHLFQFIMQQSKQKDTQSSLANIDSSSDSHLKNLVDLLMNKFQQRGLISAVQSYENSSTVNPLTSSAVVQTHTKNNDRSSVENAVDQNAT